MWQDFLVALALVLVIEGILPALNPRAFKRTMQALTGMSDRFLRGWGLFSMSLGAILIFVFKG